MDSASKLNSATAALAQPAPKPVTPSATTPITEPPKMHDGGRVLTDGVYGLKAGEHVLTEPQAKMARRHAMMSIGMKSLGKKPEAGKPTAGQPTKVDAAHKKPEKKVTKGVTVRPEKNQAAKIPTQAKK